MTCVLLADCGWDAAAPEPVAVPIHEMTDSPSTAPATTAPDHPHAEPALVDATAVSIVGDLTDREREIVDWALDRFALADLRLPPVIAVTFTDDDVCHGRLASCRPGGSPPQIAICAPDGEHARQLIDRRVAALHEFAHVWHYAQRENGDWPDFTHIVGGVRNGVDTCWDERMEERVAVVISWGLMDQLRRPVRSDQPCVTLAEQFVALTGHLPLGPIEEACVRAPG